MFLSCFIALAFASTALGGPFKPFDGLTVELSGPSTSVKSIDELKLTTSIKNTGSESVKILKYGTILDDNLPTKSFIVMKDGIAVPFTGIKPMVSLTDLDDSEFTIIGAGETVTVSHDVASLFNFASVGTGKFTFQPKTTFQVAGAEETSFSASTLSKVQVIANSLDIEVTHDVAHRGLKKTNKRAVNICTDATKQAFIDASYTEAKTLASASLSYIKQTGPNDLLYKAYWGNNPDSSVTPVLNAVNLENSSSRTLDCTDPFGACDGGVIAYTVISTTSIYYCPIFFNEVATNRLCTDVTVASRSVRGGATFHELTHAVSGTEDVTYGCANDQALSDSQSVINADSYSCFATQVYKNTQC